MGKKKKMVLTLYLDDDIDKRFRSICKEAERSLAYRVTKLIENFILTQGADEPPQQAPGAQGSREVLPPATKKEGGGTLHAPRER